MWQLHVHNNDNEDAEDKGWSNHLSELIFKIDTVENSKEENLDSGIQPVNLLSTTKLIKVSFTITNS